MSKTYCLDIEFLGVDFNEVYPISKAQVNKVLHGHLITSKDEIEMRIFCDESSYFGNKFDSWTRTINSNNFGAYIKANIRESHLNGDLQKVDFSDAKLCGYTISTNFYEGNQYYIIINIDTVKLYRPPNQDKKNTAEFYFDDTGFKVVEPFYGILLPKTLFQNDGKFEINRMENSSSFYKLGKSSFRPEFNFYSRNKRGDRSATIIKEPKIQFKYHDNITEKEAIKYGDIVLKISSFFHHSKINYQTCIIYLPDKTITIKKVGQKTIETKGFMWDFGIHGNFNHFLQMHWQESTLKNYALLSKAIKLFNQSLLVDDSSAFLIRYNIIEICDKQKQSTEKFTTILTKKQRKVKQGEALIKLLETIKEEEHEEFKKRWCNVQSLLQNKPMKNQLVSFLESQNLDPKTFPVNIKDLKELRDNITHGSIDKVNIETLRKSNMLLYRISGILILNLMGIQDWKLNTVIK